jgi:hypothetical protein
VMRRNTLRLRQISLSSPYNLTSYPELPYFFTFTTDRGIIYSCRFGNVPSLSPLLGIYDLEVRDFLFYPHYPTKPFKKSRDERVFPTIMGMIEDYLESPDRVLIYVCDSSDKKEKARQKLFSDWHETVQDTILRHELEIEVDDDLTLECGVMVNKSCKHHNIIQEELLEKSYEVILPKYGR